jgi:hypothetical protein
MNKSELLIPLYIMNNEKVKYNNLYLTNKAKKNVGSNQQFRQRQRLTLNNNSDKDKG